MNNEKIVNFFFEIATLRRLTRSHQQMIKGVNDNISDHSFRVAVIGMILAKLENADENKVLKMCLFHDVPETRIGDANFINKQYITQREEEALDDQLEGLPIGDEIKKIFAEYEARETKESLVAKDADMIDQLLLEHEYLYNDKENKAIWNKYSFGKLKTGSAKVLAEKILESNPMEWLYVLAEKKTGEKINR